MKRVTTLIGVLAAAGLVCVQCGGPTAPGPTAPPTSPGPAQPIPDPTPIPTIIARTEIFVGAGDIGWCGSPGVALTGQAARRDRRDGVCRRRQRVYVGHGTAVSRLLRTRMGPAQGPDPPDAGQSRIRNAGRGALLRLFRHERRTAGAGLLQLPARQLARDLAQQQHRRRRRVHRKGDGSSFDLAANPSKCTIAYWHHPLFSSGQNGDNPGMRAFWRILYAAGVDVVVVGHDHLYERFAPQDPDGRFDPVRGIRQFIAGTGGAQPV